MKRTYLSLLLLLITATPLWASHYLGGDLRYEYTGSGNTYRVYLTLYKVCDSPPTSLGSVETIQFSSASCNLTFSRAVPAISMDTLAQIYCPTVTQTSCQNLSSLNPGFIVGTYSDTVSLPPCSNWKLVWTSGARNAAIVNLTPNQGNLWVEAFLNNSTAPNSSAYIANLPPFLNPVGTAISTPIHATDNEGDSTASQWYIPQNAGGVNFGYVAGYSFASPLGGGVTQINNNTRLMATGAPNAGKYVLAMRTYDYRNGQMVGYSSRDWTIMSMNGINNPKVPLPATGTNFTAITCPGQTSSVTLNFTDSVATDSVKVLFVPTNNWTYTTSYTSGLGSGSGTISWTTPASLNPAITPYFHIRVLARDNACPVSGFAWYNIIVRTAQCAIDTVWAGDANDDYTVNMYDPLAIAIAYGDTGAARTAPTIAWVPQVCANWNLFFPNNVNRKHADCDGNGTVNNTDLNAVTANYGFFHTKGSFQHVAKVTGLPDLYFDHTGINAYPGSAVSLPIKLGSSASTMNNVYGLAATVKISGITPGAAAISYPVSWLGNAANTVRFTKATSSNAIDWAYARNDHQNISGQGVLSNLGFTIPAGTPVGQKVILIFENVKMIDATGAEIHAFNNLSDTFTVKPTGVAQIMTPVSTAVIVPNPSQQNSVLQLSLQQNIAFTVTVTDIAGKLVWHTDATTGSGAQQVVLPASVLKAGIYMVRIAGNGWQYPEVLKWVKE